MVGQRISAQALIHSFHCQDPRCAYTDGTGRTCAEIKCTLLRMCVHVQHAERDPHHRPNCNVCRLWDALQRTMPPPSADGGEGGAPWWSARERSPQQLHRSTSSASSSASDGSSADGPPFAEAAETLFGMDKSAMRQMDPCQLKTMLLGHMRGCPDPWVCQVCSGVRERSRRCPAPAAAPAPHSDESTADHRDEEAGEAVPAAASSEAHASEAAAESPPPRVHQSVEALFTNLAREVVSADAELDAAARGGDLGEIKRAIDGTRDVASAAALTLARRQRDDLAVTEYNAKRRKRVLMTGMR